MRYRARVYELYNGHKQFNKILWGYTDAASVEQAGHFLRGRYPYPKYLVEDIMPDPRETKKEESVWGTDKQGNVKASGEPISVAEMGWMKENPNEAKHPLSGHKNPYFNLKEAPTCSCESYGPAPEISLKTVEELAKSLLGENVNPRMFETYKKGIEHEFEHGCRGKLTNITCDDPILTFKIALAHIQEDALYYEKLEKCVETK